MLQGDVTKSHKCSSVNPSKKKGGMKILISERQITYTLVWGWFKEPSNIKWGLELGNGAKSKVMKFLVLKQTDAGTKSKVMKFLERGGNVKSNT
jgi:hypothetical protein